MEDIAREAGVSRAPVSLVMRESPKVSPERRRAVLESAAALGYSPNRLASRLASRRTRTFGVLLLDLHNPVFADVYDGIAEGVAGTGNHLMVAVGSADPAAETEAIRSFVDLRADAVLLAGYTGTPEQLAAVLRGTPAVVITREVPVDGVDCVLSDDLRGGELAVEHLHELGHRRIAHLDKPEWLPYPSRRQGYLNAVRRFGLEPILLEGDMSERGGFRAMNEYLDAGAPVPSAIMAYNDVSALGVLDSLVSRGLRVPDDVSVIGYDNTELAASPLLGLTSVDLHAREIGKIAAGVALERLAGATRPRIIRTLKPTLVRRRTTAAPSGN